ncbi:MAG: hypothetical protein WCI67_04155 [Chloroflexales bacterium]
MAGSTTIEMGPGQILSEVGADEFRRGLYSGGLLRCSNLWVASAHQTDDGEIEIELYCSLDTRTDHWIAEVYYYNIDRATAALREYERTGNIPEGE